MIALQFAACLLALLPCADDARDVTPFSIETLRRLARERSAQAYVARNADDLPEWLAKLDFDGYRRIHFRPANTLWSGERLPFQVQFKHRGYLFPYRVPIHLVERDGTPAEARFEPTQFEYRFDTQQAVPPGLGYAGLSLLSPADEAGAGAEVLTFLGATYFRALGVGQRFGASLRGLAIDTASPNGEEFPEFVELWLEKPAADSNWMRLFALLDSPSTTGAYEFVLTPGAEARIDVAAWLYPRRQVGKLGLAPLTSMFLYGEERLHDFADFRPEVHDSDGVLLASGDEWIWRPLANPEGEHRISRLPCAQPRGFGLLQRDRSFENYQDLESRFEQRASYWVTPQSDWGGGALELVEIPSDAERNDNIVLYWVPDRIPSPGEEFAFRYTLSAFLDDPARSPLGRVRATRIRPAPSSALFVLDFDRIEAGTDALVAEVTSSGGVLKNVILQPNEATGGMRCTFELFQVPNEPIELRAWLRRGERRASETWSYRWSKN